MEQNGENGSDREDFLDELYGEIQKENKELKEKMKENEELTSQVRTMAGFIERSNADSTLPIALKAKTDATTALAEADKHEEDLEKIVTEWSTTNLKFLAGRKRKKSEPRNSVGPADMRTSESKVWLGSFEKTLMPKENLKAGCEVSEMKSFKKSMAIWISYIKEQGTVVTNSRYWHILSNKLDSNMKSKLEAIEGIETAGEKKIWDYIESIFQT